MRNALASVVRRGDVPLGADLPSDKFLAGKTVLVIEDESLIAIEIEEMLKQAGNEACFRAADVERASRLLDERAIDAVISDIVLNGVPTVDLAIEVRRRNIPLVFASAYGDSAALPPPLDACPFVAKPFSPAAVLEALSLAFDLAKDSKIP